MSPRTGRGRRRRTGAFETAALLSALAAWMLGAPAILSASLAAMVLLLDLAMALALRLRRRRRLRTLRGFLALSPVGFEAAVADLLRRTGYRRVRTVGGSGDLAADLTCYTPAGQLVVVQCKRWAPSHRVGSGQIQTFIGMAFVHHRAARAIFVTTSSFTPAAWRLARAHPIELVDGPRLVRLAESASSRQRKPKGPASTTTAAGTPATNEGSVEAPRETRLARSGHCRALSQPVPRVVEPQLGVRP